MTMVQLVVYPQYDQVQPADFASYIASHGIRIGFPLALFAPWEVLTAALLWFRLPRGTAKNIAFLSGALLALAWVTTAVWFGPLHGRLIGEPYDPANIDLLTNTNWFRTTTWWTWGVLAAVILDRTITLTPRQRD